MEGQDPVIQDGRDAPLKIAVVGAGISGMSAAWLLNQAHQVTLYEAEPRLGGHSHTVDAVHPGRTASALPVDMGFIVYNEITYPNLTALFAHLEVPTKVSNMGFAVSLDDGRMEYGGDNLVTLFSQARNLFRPRFWAMLRDLVRFYREAPGHACALDAEGASLGDYLNAQGYGRAFQDDHILPQAAAIWSASTRDIQDYPAAAFIRFFENHGLLKIVNRPIWRTVDGGSRAYVERLTAPLKGRIRTGAPVVRIARTRAGVEVRDAAGGVELFDQVVVATHADQGLALLDQPSPRERAVLGAFGYSRNLAVLHTDPALMPRRRATWSAWNYIGRGEGSDQALCVSYWMNRLQDLPRETPLFVTLNPVAEPDPKTVIHTETYMHPRFDAAALRAQEQLWSLQGEGGVWWCGAHFGSGFHEDGLQAGLAVAEQLGGVRRPWRVTGESDRIHLGPPPPRPTRAPLGEPPHDHAARPDPVELSALGDAA
ncbi:MAG: FAD-dependent oxidoreductase [Alphaproteobacteria bacterium]|nr:FAD-dependent oxidoreductase [Alphaproteobacteria bacterium]